MDPGEQPEPTLPPAEQMRQRRLAKLAGSSPATSSSPKPASQSATPAPALTAAPAAAPTPNQPSETPSSSVTATPQIRITPKPTSTPNPAGSASAPNPFSQLARKKPEPENSPSADTDAHPVKKANIAAGESLEEWSDRILSDIFLITVDNRRIVDFHSTKLTYLPELSHELEQSGEPARLSTSTIDAAILEAARLVPSHKALLDYLLPCWKRVMRANKPARRPSPEKEAVLHEAKRLCMSNCIFALTMPEYFGRDPNPNHDSLVPYLLRNHDNEDGVCLDFFTEAISRINEDDTILPVFSEAMVIISARVAQMNMNDDYKPYINCLVTYSRFPQLLDALARHPRFQVGSIQDATKEELARASEIETILGPFFRISPLQTEVTKTYFANPRTMDAGHIKSSQSALQMTLKAHQGDLISIVNAFVRASPTAKNATLDWFAFGLNSNHKRRALQVKATEVASDGFMVNVTAVLDKLCEPFMDATFSKISKVDLDYLRRTPRVDMSDETKLNADQATSDSFYSDKVSGTSNFISEVFFLTLAAHHYGLGATNSKLKDLEKDIKYVEKVIKQMEEELAKFQSDALRAAIAKQRIQQAVDTVEKYISLKHAIHGVVLDQGTQTLSLQFMRYVAVWLLRTASRTDYQPGKRINLPLSVDKPAAFSCLPEYALQDVVENFKFVFRFMPNILMSAVGDEIITLCITFLRSSEYIKNPYLKSSLVTLLFSGTWPMYHLSRGVLGDSLMGSEFANEHLLHSLMKFYIECEHSGVSSAFYDKFNIRYEIFQVIKTIWPNNVYKDKLSRESRVNRQFFVQFVNLLLNDATYLLDEALTKLVKIHDYQKQLQSAELSPEDREKIRTDLEQAEQQCQSWMQLVNDTMGMMKLFTETLRDSFTMPEIVVRLAGMLNYNLESLVGPKRGQLKVEDATKYHFDPKTLLSDFVDVYLNLGPKPDFVRAVASDGRSYKPSNFETVSRLLQHSLGKPPETVVAWDGLRKKIAEAKDELDQAELDLGEIPPEFEDPIMGDLMTDPVILPSRHIMDRSTIVQQLLSTPKDPFSNVHMTIDDVIPADDLRKQIQAWKAERIAIAKAKGSGEVMDTSEG
ncbi:ubiquitin elongating factor core-domain-containing protein [Nemania sp. FL0916]|nr:ubiquitin elongating factor core-domain-containing protein [Nemania sp. FL0916]